jgi:hypothetical protein
MPHDFGQFFGRQPAVFAVPHIIRVNRHHRFQAFQNLAQFTEPEAHAHRQKAPEEIAELGPQPWKQAGGTLVTGERFPTIEPPRGVGIQPALPERAGSLASGAV